MSKYGQVCKVCNTKWTETPTLIGDMWYDCLKCEKTAEQIEEEYVEPVKERETDVPWSYTGMLL